MFKIKDKSIITDVPVLEVLIPQEYESRSMFLKSGEMFNMFAVCMARSFPSQTSYDKNSKKQYTPIILPYMIITKPSVVESDIVEVPIGGKPKNMFRLLYYIGDIFSKNLDYIKSSDNTQNIYQLIDDGKGDFLPYTAILKVLEEVHYYNGTTMPVPIEAIAAITAEKCRSVNNHNVQARRMKETPYVIQCLNPRESVLTDTTFNMLNFEDTNTAIMISANKAASGVVDEPSVLERVIRGDYEPSTNQ